MLSTTGGHGTGCTLTVAWTPAWSGSPAYAVNVYPPLSTVPAAGDQMAISQHKYAYRQLQFAPTLQALSFHAPVNPTVSGALGKLDAAAGQQPGVRHQRRLSADRPDGRPRRARHRIAEHLRRGLLGDGALTPGEINYQIEVHPDSSTFPATTTPAFNVVVTALHAYDVATTITDASISSVGGEAQGVTVRRAGLPDVLVMFGARKGYRIHQSGYTVTYTVAMAPSTVYLCDLDPSRTNSYTLDAGGSTPLTPTAAGVATISVSGTGSHTIVLTVV